jgi:hypothetical protein
MSRHRGPDQLLKDAPKGWCNEALVESGPSTLGPAAGLGLFATQDIPQGTVIGEARPEAVL